jgi:hypothetical protein
MLLSCRTMTDFGDYKRANARELIRQLIEEARRDIERQEAKEERLRTLMKAGKASGLKATELAAASGLSRPSVYETLRRDAQGSTEDLGEIVLATLAACGATTRSALASLLRVSDVEIAEAVQRLAECNAVKFGAAGYDNSSMQEIVILDLEGEQLLDHRLRRALHGRPEQWVAYLAMNNADAHALAQEAEARFGQHRATLIPEKTARRMESPELAIGFDVANEIDLFNQAAEAWHSLRDATQLDPAPVRIVAFVAPLGHSEILAAVGRGIVEANPKIDRAITRAIADSEPSDDEFTICVRALTEAAWALRRSVEQENRPPLLSDGEKAFAELQPVASLVLDGPREKIQVALVRALKRAADRLGPFPAGQIGSFRGPDEEPHIVGEVTPSVTDLTKIAEASGQALGYAHAATRKKVDAIEEIKMVASSST